LQKPTQRDEESFGTRTGSPKEGVIGGEDWEAGVVWRWEEEVLHDSLAAGGEGDGGTEREGGNTMGMAGVPIGARELVPPAQGATACAWGGCNGQG